MTTDIKHESLQSFIARTQLEMACQRVAGRADGNGDAWDKTARHFLCTIKRVGFGPCEPLTLFFSQGSAHTKPPTLADVLDCLASDACSVDNARNFAEWAGEMGYNEDSRKAEKTYRTCCEQRDALKALLGASYDALLYQTERL